MISAILALFLSLNPSLLFQQTIILKHKAVAGNTFSLVQNTFTSANGVPQSSCVNVNTTCPIAVSSTGSGHAGVLISTGDNGTSYSISSVSGGGTWTTSASCNAGSGAIGFITCAYNMNLTGGATTITVTWSNSGAGPQLYYYEYSCTPGPCVFDSVSTASIGSGNPINGVTPSLSGTSDVIVQGIIVGSANPTAVAVYGNIQIPSDGFMASADRENTSSTTPPSWTLSGASAAFGNYVAIK